MSTSLAPIAGAVVNCPSLIDRLKSAQTAPAASDPAVGAGLTDGQSRVSRR